MTLNIGDKLIELDRETGLGVRPDEHRYPSFEVIELGPRESTEVDAEGHYEVTYVVKLRELS